MHCVLVTSEFMRDAKQAGLDDEEVSEIVRLIAADPTGGVVIPRTGGARKLRVKAKAKGKRSGYRVVWFYGGDDIPVFLLSMFVKGERIDLTEAERNALKKHLSSIGEEYRAGVSGKVTKLGKAS